MSDLDRIYGRGNPSHPDPQGTAAAAARNGPSVMLTVAELCAIAETLRRGGVPAGELVYVWRRRFLNAAHTGALHDPERSLAVYAREGAGEAVIGPAGRAP